MDASGDVEAPEDDEKVLVVEDEDMVAEMYRDWLSMDGYTVDVAYGGREALLKIDGGVTTVLLDRRMPYIAGDDVLEVVKSDDVDELDPADFEDDAPLEEYSDVDIRPETLEKLDREIVENLTSHDVDPQVCMVTAVDPDMDILEMEFDHYVTKDVKMDEVIGIVEGMRSLRGLEPEEREYQALNWKKKTLQESKPNSVLNDNDEYQRILEKMEAIEQERGTVEEIKEIEPER